MDRLLAQAWNRPPHSSLVFLPLSSRLPQLVSLNRTGQFFSQECTQQEGRGVVLTKAKVTQMLRLQRTICRPFNEASLQSTGSDLQELMGLVTVHDVVSSAESKKLSNELTKMVWDAVSELNIDEVFVEENFRQLEEDIRKEQECMTRGYTDEEAEWSHLRSTCAASLQAFRNCPHMPGQGRKFKALQDCLRQGVANKTKSIYESLTERVMVFAETCLNLTKHKGEQFEEDAKITLNAMLEARSRGSSVKPPSASAMSDFEILEQNVREAHVLLRNEGDFDRRSNNKKVKAAH
ncbi:hypothetical protein T439DRAFT_171555 [Meredithblackwellia eburnea MCA 4105]